VNDNFVDPYINPRTGILSNLVNAKTQDQLDASEYAMTWLRRQELERSPISEKFDLALLQDIHHTLFQDVYPWAGQLRTIEIGKGGSWFHNCNRFDPAAQWTFDYIRDSPLVNPNCGDDEFVVAAAEALSRINYMHPFREGNGRTQRAFLDMLAKVSGRTLAWRNVSKEENLRASIAAMQTGEGAAFQELMTKIIKSAADGLSLLDDRLYETASQFDISDSEPRPSSPIFSKIENYSKTNF